MKMHAMLVNAAKRLVWSEVAEPIPGENDVLIEVHATALNRADLMQRAGEYPSPPGWPEWMGLEAAGVIAKAPGSSRWRVGDKVCALLGGGGYAERVAVPADMVLPIPSGLSMEEAAAIPEAFAHRISISVLKAACRRAKRFSFKPEPVDWVWRRYRWRKRLEPR